MLVMSGYKKILVVVDLSADSERVVERAKAIAACYQSQIELLHVVEYIPLEPIGETLLPTIQIENELVQRATIKLGELAERLGLMNSPRLVQAGSIKGEIIRIAQEHQVDLIVLGSRERHGLAILVNFTDDTVLHQAPCDILAVRLQKK
jgi:universal stress protein A